MSLYRHYFLPLSPPIGRDEYLRLKSLGDIQYATQAGFTLAVQLLCLDEQVRIIAVTLPIEAVSHQDRARWFDQIMENIITALRLNGDHDACPIYVGDYYIRMDYDSDSPVPEYKTPIYSIKNSDFKLDISKVLGIFQLVATKPRTKIASLIAEAQVPAIPAHYRLLSVIKAIELLYPRISDRNRTLDQYQGHFAKLSISNKQLRNALPEIRTRCAHGVSTGRENPEPFVGIGYSEPHLVPLLQLLRSIVCHGFKEIHGVELKGMLYDPLRQEGS